MIRNRLKSSTWLAGLAAALALTTAALPASAADRALLIGIDKYKMPAINLIGSENDVTDISALLKNQFGYKQADIKTLLNEQATRRNILGEIEEWLVNGTKAGDRVTLFYSGHGYRIADANGDDGDGLDETIVPYDTAQAPGKFENLILDDEIGGLLNRMKDRKVTVIIDSCFSGTLTRGELLKTEPPKKGGANLVKSLAVVLGQEMLPPPDQMNAGTRAFSALPENDPDSAKPLEALQEAADNPLSPKNVEKEKVEAKDVTERAGGFIERRDHVVAWSAVSATQLALVDADEARPGGVFTKRFIKGLRDKAADNNKDGKVNHQELLDYVRGESQIFCDGHKAECKDGLSPLLEASSAAGLADVISLARPASVRQEADQGLTAPKRKNEVAEAVKISTDRTEYKLGDTMRFRFTSSENGYLIVLDVNAKDQVTQIFPNKLTVSVGETLQVRAGTTITVPGSNARYAFRASEPTGEGVLFAILSKDPLRVDDLLRAPSSGRGEDGRPGASGDLRGFEVVEDPRTFIERLSDRLREIAERPDTCTVKTEDDACKDRPKLWWSAKAAYRINSK